MFVNCLQCKGWNNFLITPNFFLTFFYLLLENEKVNRLKFFAVNDCMEFYFFIFLIDLI